MKLVSSSNNENHAHLERIRLSSGSTDACNINDNMRFARHPIFNRRDRHYNHAR